MTRNLPLATLPVLILATYASADPKSGVLRTLTAEDVLNITWAVAPEVSPDGSQVLYTVVESSANGRQKSIWISPTSEDAAARRIFAQLRGVSRVRWSTDGRHLAFLAIDGQANRRKQLFIASGDGSQPRRLTQMPNGVIDHRWSGDGTTIAFTSGEQPEQSTKILVAQRDTTRNSLWTIGLDGRQPQRISSDDQHIVDFAWAPDGESFAALVATARAEDVAVMPASLIIQRRSDGATERVLGENATGGCEIAWSPDGRTIAAAVHSPQKLSRRLALFAAEGGEICFPFADLPATPMGRIEWTADSRYLFVRFAENTRNQLLRLDTDTREFKRVCHEILNFWDYSISRDGTTLALNAESQHDPPDIFVSSNGHLVRLTDFNEHFDEFRLGNVSTVQWRSSLDNRVIYGVLITPTGGQVAAPYPTIVNLHSGPHWFWWEGWIGTYMSWGQFLATHGYAVFLPNHRGSIGQGWPFVEAHVREWGRGDYQDVMDGVEWLVQHDIADPKRLGIGGSSFGGYLAAWTVTQTERFQACVVEAGWTDLVSSNLTTDAPAPLRLYMEGNELERVDLYRSRSPLTFVKKCKTPTLILHGEHDRRVPTDQGRAFHRALTLSGVDCELVIYRNEAHGLTKRENQLDAMNRIKNWFDRHLMN